MKSRRFTSGRVGALALSGMAAFAGAVLLVAPASPAAASKPRSVSITFSCALPTGSSASAAATFVGSTPPSVTKPGKVSMSGFQAQVTISGSTLDTLSAYVSSVKGTVKTLDVNASDAKTKSVNAAGKGIKFGPVTVLSSNNPNLVIDIPASPATVGPWTATKKGKMTFTAGKASITLITSGTVSGTFTVGCTPKAPDTLSTTTVK